MHSLIYLDNSTTSRPSEKAVSEMMPFWTTYWGVPSAVHQKGQELYPFLKEYYQMLYAFLGAKPEDQIVVTSSGAEAVNHVISSVYRDVTLPTGKNQFLASVLSEAPAIMSINRLEVFGSLGKLVDANAHGVITAEAVAKRLSPRTALLSVSLVNGLTGVIQPVAEIAALCQERGVRLHIDVTHAIGKLSYDLEELGADYITFNADPLHAPKGSGLLYIKHGVTTSPFIFGSADQAGMRAGNFSVASLAGLAKACQESLECRDLLCTETARLRSLLEEGILTHCPGADICFRNQERAPHCTTVVFPGISNEALLFYLNRRGLCATIGGGNFQQLSLLLMASGFSESVAQTAISFSLSRYTTEDEIERAIVIIKESVASLTKLGQHLDF